MVWMLAIFPRECLYCENVENSFHDKALMNCEVPSNGEALDSRATLSSHTFSMETHWLVGACVLVWSLTLNWCEGSFTITI